MFKKHQRWNPRGWPWELEIIVSALVVIGFAMPYIFSLVDSPTPTEPLSLVEIAAQNDASRFIDVEQIGAQSRALMGGLMIIGLYLGHLLIAHHSLDLVTTPAIYYVSPALFGALSYYRLLHQSALSGQNYPFVTGSLVEKIGYPLAFMTLTFVLARWRMKRQMRAYDDIEWDYSARPIYDKGILANLATSITPFLYPVKKIQVCKDGILLRGSLFLLPIPIRHIQSVLQSKRRNNTSGPINLTTSNDIPLRIQFRRSTRPILITPKRKQDLLDVFQNANGKRAA